MSEPTLERWVSPKEAARLLGLESELGDELAVILEAEPGGLSCAELARRLHRRKADVLDALQTDRRFKRTGRGRGCRFRRRYDSWEPIGTGTQREPGDRPEPAIEAGREA